MHLAWQHGYPLTEWPPPAFSDPAVSRPRALSIEWREARLISAVLCDSTTRSEAADRLGVSVETLMKWLHDGRANFLPRCSPSRREPTVAREHEWRERRLIAVALRAFDGDCERAAHALDMAGDVFRERMENYLLFTD